MLWHTKRLHQSAQYWFLLWRSSIIVHCYLNQDYNNKNYQKLCYPCITSWSNTLPACLPTRLPIYLPACLPKHQQNLHRLFYLLASLSAWPAIACERVWLFWPCRLESGVPNQGKIHHILMSLGTPRNKAVPIFEMYLFQPILDDRLKENILKPRKGALSSHFRLCVCFSVRELLTTVFELRI